MKMDWNDLLLEAGSGEEARRNFDTRRRDFEGQAKLLLAETPSEYARIYAEVRGHRPGLFEFAGQYHYAAADGTLPVSDFILEVDHFRIDSRNPEEHEYQYRLKVIPRKGKPKTFTASAEEISTPEMLTKLFLKRARVLWMGSRAASTALIRRILSSGAPEVRQLSSIGLDAETGCYVFRHFLINREGKKVLPNKKGIFELSPSTALRPFPMATLNPEEHLTTREIYQGICGAWGLRGAVGVAFTVAAWFVSLVKEQLGYFPFLSFWGDPTSGKTFLAIALNATQCLDEEGLPMSKENTAKGELRFLSQVSGLSRALLEAKEKGSRFDFNKLLTLYNKNFLQVRGNKSLDNQINLLEWRGGLTLVQNVEPTKTAAQKSRLVSLKFCTEDIKVTKEAFARVQSWKKEWQAQFFVEVMAHKQRFEREWYPTFCRIDKSLEGEIPEPRIRGNHALILAFHEILMGVLGLAVDLRPFILHLAKNKILDCQREASTLADYFFDALDQLPSDQRDQCARLDAQGRLHVWLPTAVKLLGESGLMRSVNLSQLQDDLRSHPACLNNRHCSRKFSELDGSRSKHVYLFDSAKIVGKDDGADEPEEVSEDEGDEQG